MSPLVRTQADSDVANCLSDGRSFALIAGAGAGKTTSLISALDTIRREFGQQLLKHGQRVACITYTKRAVGVIQERLGFDEFFVVSTIHSFLWTEIAPFGIDIDAAVKEIIIPSHITLAKEKDNGGTSKEALAARRRALTLAQELAALPYMQKWSYDDSRFSSFSDGLLGHDDVIAVAGYLLNERKVFRRILGSRYPYIFVDEAQDTFPPIVDGLNKLASGIGPPVVGYFGDPWQQIYDRRAGNFAPPREGLTITKTENFRCCPEVVTFLNAFRTDVTQVSAGEASERTGSVALALIEAEAPEGPRKSYTTEQTDRALKRMDYAFEGWGWLGRADITTLFLVRQMIARRLGFENLNTLFTGRYASSRAQDDFESGEHFLLRPFMEILLPLMRAHEVGDQRRIIDLLRGGSPGFESDGPNRNLTLAEMIRRSDSAIRALADIWETHCVKDVLEKARELELATFPNRLVEHLDREAREEVYIEEQHSNDKGDWLADAFFSMRTDELFPYFDFISRNTPFSTQHGVKGEEYPNVAVIFDDIEAKWSHYSFTKLLTPKTSGSPTEGQLEKGRKLAYVSFSRAALNLRIILFTPNPDAAKEEIVEQGLLGNEQIVVVKLAT